ncbi:hypothetical protein, partial [Vibrio parahaemolyticus]|uniref:hypothetical protein n=1 Tax=Vibrio parahaemolyticus TaxID=670 RepID=UPI001C60CCCE
VFILCKMLRMFACSICSYLLPVFFIHSNVWTMYVDLYIEKVKDSPHPNPYLARLQGRFTFKITKENPFQA